MIAITKPESTRGIEKSVQPGGDIFNPGIMMKKSLILAGNISGEILLQFEPERSARRTDNTLLAQELLPREIHPSRLSNASYDSYN
jgi:hypothetical protein